MMTMNPSYDALPSYPFPRLRALLNGIDTQAADVFDLTLGAPTQPPPSFIQPILAEHFLDFGKYPPIAGTPLLKEAITAWIKQRYGAAIDPKDVLPLVGTREGLYMLAQLMAKPEGGKGARSKVLLPNPYYPAYSAAALTIRAEPVYLTCDKSTGFLPDLDALSASTLDQTALLFLCSPSNPQGAAASKSYLSHALTLARKHGFLLAVDECYAEIWTQTPPIGALDVADGDYCNLVVFHSLSKRSNAPGLRSGFIAGDSSVIAGFEKLRSYGGPTMPIPLQAASAACWSDQAHVEESRALYRQKFEIAENVLGITRPQGGFFLWLPVKNAEKTAKTLWKDHGVRVLPGPYLASAPEKGQNPGDNYIRIALVDGVEETRTALERIAKAL